MTPEQTEEIISRADTRGIVQALRALGYRETAKDKRYSSFPVVTIVRGHGYKTEWKEDKRGKFEYRGSVYSDTEGAEEAEFVFVSINRIDRRREISLPYKILIFVKERNGNEH